MPEITEQILQILKPQSERLEIEFKQMLDALAECFRQGDCRVRLPTVHGALSEMDDAIQQIRDRKCLEANLRLEAPLRVLELVERYHATGEALEECGQLVRTLEIQRYWGDYPRCSRRIPPMDAYLIETRSFRRSAKAARDPRLPTTGRLTAGVDSDRIGLRCGSRDGLVPSAYFADWRASHRLRKDAEWR